MMLVNLFLFVVLDIIEPWFVFGSDVIEPMIVGSDVIEPMIIGGFWEVPPCLMLLALFQM